MKLHLGCGKRFIPGFVHIDVLPLEHVDHVSSIDNLPFIADNSVDLIYNCHVLEHFKRKDTLRVLAEWFRVLKKGGILRTAVPDFEQLCYIYNRDKNIDVVVGAIYGGQDYLYNIHYNVFDFSSLEVSLSQVGFSSVRRYDWRDTEHGHIDDYSQAYVPHMDKENGVLISLNVEAVK
jgi:predicted SAM-dependent methyltransferase